ncbi:MAG: hypothetical protein QME66_13540, partial [Candidatus Eisenbacteria bacterium]|nr:hypothetical protein [Candidatus Eisenbacteria bacterium]
RDAVKGTVREAGIAASDSRRPVGCCSKRMRGSAAKPESELDAVIHSKLRTGSRVESERGICSFPDL